MEKFKLLSEITQKKRNTELPEKEHQSIFWKIDVLVNCVSWRSSSYCPR
jgi:hypothetical protein